MTIGRTYELLNSGDWACAWGDPGTLAAVAFELAGVLDPDLAVEADIVSGLAGRDFAEATRRWAKLAGRLEHGIRLDAHGRIIPAAHGAGHGLRLRELMTAQLLSVMEM